MQRNKQSHWNAIAAAGQCRIEDLSVVGERASTNNHKQSVKSCSSREPYERLLTWSLTCREALSRAALPALSKNGSRKAGSSRTVKTRHTSFLPRAANCGGELKGKMNWIT